MACAQPQRLAEAPEIVLIVIGILLPALAAAREAGRRTVCASNLRQLCHGFLMYAQEHKFHLPRGAPQGTTPGLLPRPHDWIHWNYGRDLKQSAIARYLTRLCLKTAI